MSDLRKHRLYPLLCLFLVGGILTASSWDNVVALYSTIRAQSWEQTPCELSHVGLKEHRVSQRRSQRKMKNYSLDVRYQYEYKGRRYVSRCHDFWETEHSPEQAKKLVQALDHHPSPTCYVNPAHPQEAVMDRSPDTGKALLMGAVALLFVLSGGYLLLGKDEPAPKKRTLRRRAGHSN